MFGRKPKMSVWIMNERTKASISNIYYRKYNHGFISPFCSTDLRYSVVSPSKAGLISRRASWTPLQHPPLQKCNFLSHRQLWAICLVFLFLMSHFLHQFNKLGPNRGIWSKFSTTFFANMQPRATVSLRQTFPVLLSWIPIATSPVW